MKPVDLVAVATQALDEVCESTRGRAAGFVFPSDVDAMLAEVEALSWRLGQVLAQAGEWLVVQDGAGRVGHDQGGDVGTAVDRARASIAWAMNRADELSLAMSGARSFTSHLTGIQTTAPASASAGGE